MAPRKPRHLSPAERALWEQVAARTRRLGPERPTDPAPGLAKPPPKPPRPQMPLPAQFRIGETAASRPLPHDLARSVGEAMAQQPVAMDRKKFGKLKQGRVAPEARLDLHGMTIAQAHPALTRFILDAVADGRRLVLVITGKGKMRDEGGPIPVRHGVLRHQVPHWLSAMPLKPHVLQTAEAHLKHGGQGAIYVYLRRAR